VPFESLTPDAILTAAEKITGQKFTNLTISLPSYINRVYELKTCDNQKLIAKFYRPNRWTKDAIQDEHDYLLDCENAELPVVAPQILANGKTVDTYDDMLVSIFPKRAGRQLEITSEEFWPRLGSLIARMHLCGEKKVASHRIVMDPMESTLADVNHLVTNIVPERLRDSFKSIAMKIIDASAPLFDNKERIRIHGDCHRGNILDRMDDGLLVIDFDDMAMGLPVQDLWLLLPDRANKCSFEISMFLDGYERFRRFDKTTIVCIESLRAMRMIYFVSWCSRQVDDFLFKRNFPEWGSDSFWQKELNDLREQLGFITDTQSNEEE